MAEDDSDIGANLSTAEYRAILEIPGHRLSKPLEIAVTGHREKGVVVAWSALHHLPSLNYGSNTPTGEALVGRGATPEEATNNLCSIIVDCWNGVKRVSLKNLKPEARLQKHYLMALFLR